MIWLHLPTQCDFMAFLMVIGEGDMEAVATASGGLWNGQALSRETQSFC